MNKNNIYHKIVIVIITVTAVFLLYFLFIKSRDDTYDFPVKSPMLDWGSSKEDVIAKTNAEPVSSHDEIFSTQVLYTDEKIETLFGISSETRFFIITDSTVPVGLYGVQFTFDNYTYEETKEAIFNQYKDINDSVKWGDSGNLLTTFYYPESARFIHMSDSQWNVICDYYTKMSIASAAEELEYKLNKMRNNEYYFMIQITEPNVVFINALPLAILSNSN